MSPIRGASRTIFVVFSAIVYCSLIGITSATAAITVAVTPPALTLHPLAVQNFSAKVGGANQHQRYPGPSRQKSER